MPTRTGERQHTGLTWHIAPSQTPSPACLYCAGTQASVRRQREIQAARLGYPTAGVCCVCDTSPACPRCLAEHLEYGSYDFGTDPQTGYADAGERYYCPDCGATGDGDDLAAVPLPLDEPRRMPMVTASYSGGIAGACPDANTQSA